MSESTIPQNITIEERHLIAADRITAFKYVLSYDRTRAAITIFPDEPRSTHIGEREAGRLEFEGLLAVMEEAVKRRLQSNAN